MHYLCIKNRNQTIKIIIEKGNDYEESLYTAFLYCGPERYR